MGHTRKARYDLASNAMTTPPDLGRKYVWNAQGQLIAIRQGNRELARYRYNHHGLRVGKQTGRLVRYRNGSTTTQRAMTAPSGMNWPDTEQFISYQSGNRRYVTGVGTEHIDNEYGNIKHWTGNTIDSGANYSGPDRITRMVQYFNDEADAFDDETAMDVDIIGFSRGAAQARDFANWIVTNTQYGWYSYKDKSGTDKCQKVNFRFMGLYDTVLSTNLSGYSYNLGIPEEFSYVAQAVALNEYRGKTLRSLPGSVGAFPLESILDGIYSLVPIAGQTRIKRGLIGSHSDIGGGFEQGDLSRVALSWMVDQAHSAGVTMDNAPTTIVANPVLHDKSDNQYSPTGAPAADGEDRQVRYGNGSTTTQRAMIASSGMSWSDTGQFISYLPRTIDQNGDVIPRAYFVTGTVDAQAYLNWLNANGYNINITVQ